MIRENRVAPGRPMRVVLELNGGDGTVSGTLVTAEGRRTFWGWLELMSALERAAEVEARQVNGAGR